MCIIVCRQIETTHSFNNMVMTAKMCVLKRLPCSTYLYILNSHMIFFQFISLTPIKKTNVIFLCYRIRTRVIHLFALVILYRNYSSMYVVLFHCAVYIMYLSIVVVLVSVFCLCHANVIIPIIEIHIFFVVIRLDCIQHYNDIDTAMQNNRKFCKECR